MGDVITGDAFEILEALDNSSFHAIVTDPPYGLAFMGRDWDDFEPKEYQEWCERWAALALNVLKPGGHLLAFSGNRTHHRLFSGVEDAGFEVRDTLTWHYGSGFPKALDVSKAIDKAAGAEREVVGYDERSKGIKPGAHNYGGDSAEYEAGHPVTAPATDAAREWDGFKTALKPATEFIVLARKPFEGTVAENVQAHGAGALNIDGCRIETEDGFGWDKTDIPENTNRPPRGARDEPAGRVMARHTNADGERVEPEGRYPANVIFDGTEAERLDREVGELGGGPRRTHAETNSSEWDTDVNEGYTEGRERSAFVNDPEEGLRSIGDSGGPSRYFYTSKATRTERTLDGKIENAHPTVKPIDLMEWLVRLVTKESQHVLDPFAGTGTTGRAAKNIGRTFTLIERNERWAEVARARCGLTPENPDLLTDEQQATLGI